MLAVMFVAGAGRPEARGMGRNERQKNTETMLAIGDSELLVGGGGYETMRGGGGA